MQDEALVPTTCQDNGVITIVIGKGKSVVPNTLCKEIGREVGDLTVAFFTTHKRERTQGWRLKPIFTLAHNNNTMKDGYTLYV